MASHRRGAALCQGASFTRCTTSGQSHHHAIDHHPAPSPLPGGVFVVAPHREALVGHGEDDGVDDDVHARNREQHVVHLLQLGGFEQLVLAGEAHGAGLDGQQPPANAQQGAPSAGGADACSRSRRFRG